MKSRGVSAIEKFALLLNAINQLETHRHQNFRHPLYNDPNGIAPISVGTVRGGNWHSTVAEEVVAEGRLGVFPGESNAQARAMLEATVHAAAHADPWLSQHPPKIEWIEGQFEAGETPADHPFIQLLAEAHEQVLGARPPLKGVPYGSDMRFFTNHAKIPATHYGPGDVSHAHAANEFVDLAEVVTATKVIALMLANWVNGPLGDLAME
jgi:acetylornithine deacetylase